MSWQLEKSTINKFLQQDLAEDARPLNIINQRERERACGRGKHDQEVSPARIS